MENSKPNASVLFIVVTVALDAMGIGLIAPIMPDLIVELDGGSIGDAALWGGIFLTVFSLMQFLFGPALGSLSDRYGRRPILLVSLVVMAIDYLIMGLAHSIWLILLTRVIGGITAATMPTASAYIADISPPEKKSANFGLVGAAFGIGFILGPVLGGFLAEYGTRAPFFVAAGLAGLNFLYGWFILPETVTPENRRAFDLRRASPLGGFRAVGKLPQMNRLLVTLFLYEFAFMIYPAIWTFFSKERYGWDPRWVGISLMLVGISMALVQGGVIRPALKYLREGQLIITGLIFAACAFALVSMITSGVVALVLIPISALGAVVVPTLQGQMSRRVADDQQGELQGVIASARSIAAIFAPLVFAEIFRSFTASNGVYFPGAPFLLSVVLSLVALACFIMMKRKRA